MSMTTYSVRTGVAIAFAALAATGAIDASAAEAAGKARTADAPQVRVGDQWVYHGVDGYRTKIEWDETHTVTAVAPDRTTVDVVTRGTNLNSERTETWAAPGIVQTGTICDQNGRYEPPFTRYRYPLGNKGSWSQQIRNVDRPPGPYGPISYRATIRGVEKVSTRAGTFDAVKIRYVMRLDDETISRYATQCDYLVWYAPSVGAAVREQRRSWSMDKGRSSPRIPGQNGILELVSFTRGK